MREDDGRDQRGPAPGKTAECWTRYLKFRYSSTLVLYMDMGLCGNTRNVQDFL